MTIRLSARQSATLVKIYEYVSGTEWAARFGNIEPYDAVKRSAVRVDMRALKRKGMLQLVPTFTDDGYLTGSGYVLTEQGEAIAEEIIEQMRIEE